MNLNISPVAGGGLPKPENAVTIVMSPELFHMAEEQQIYENQGMENYFLLHRERMTEHWSPGPAFSFVKALEAVNVCLRKLYPDSKELFNVVLMTSNHPQLPIDTKLYLSADETKVREALKKGIAAATMLTPKKMTEVSETKLRVAFDGDAVLFSDESEQFFVAHGLDEFEEHEQDLANKPMDSGPLKGFLEALVMLQKKFYARGQRIECPIRSFLVTSRGGGAGTRALNTLRGWGLDTDEAHFLAGAKKGPFLKFILPHIFFDDQMNHVKGALELGIVACHVPIVRVGPKKQEKDTETPCVGRTQIAGRMGGATQSKEEGEGGRSGKTKAYLTSKRLLAQDEPNAAKRSTPMPPGGHSL